MDLQEDELNLQQMDLADETSPEQAPPPQPPPAPERGPWFQYRVPTWVEWSRYTLPIAALPPEFEGVRVAQVTDMHFRGFWSDAYDQLIARIDKEAPDLILITGDFIDNRRRPMPAVPIARKFISALKARLGVFGILGNHDRYHLQPHLQDLGMTLLDRNCHRIRIDEAEIELLALPGVDRRHLTPQVLDRYPMHAAGVPRLVLSHFPDLLRKILDLKPDSYFAGHTHGGQICLPNGFPIRRHDSLPRHLCKGVHRAANTWIVISRGLGFTGLPFRVFCPAEVVEITLTRG
jgi:hypothetical protein